MPNWQHRVTLWDLWHTWRSRANEAARLKHRKKERADLLKQWDNHEPGLVRCQECREVLRDTDDHDCRNPLPPIHITVT